MDNFLFNINPNKVTEQKEIGKSGVEAAFVKAMTELGWKAYKFKSENNRGVTDRIVILPGQVWFVEIKRDKGVLSALQESFQAKCRNLGLNHFVVYGKKGISQFIRVVKEQ